MALDTHTLATVALPSGMVWADEFDWSPVQKSLEYSVTGALLIDVGVRQAGRPITLAAQDDAGWISRASLQALQALAEASPEGVHTFTHADGRSFTVQFAPVDAPITAQPVARPELPPGTHPYVATVRLITV